MKSSSAFSLLFAGSAAALKGRATTTRYYDGQKGACGCGPAHSSSNYSWQLGISPGLHTAAGSPALFGQGSWCGSGCGKCYKLTSTGKAPPNEGQGGATGKTIIVMLTNLCPHDGNQKWCPAAGQKNQFGMNYHFDIMAKQEIFGDNPIVDFESVSCPNIALQRLSSCECSG